MTTKIMICITFWKSTFLPVWWLKQHCYVVVDNVVSYVKVYITHNATEQQNSLVWGSELC